MPLMHAVSATQQPQVENPWDGMSNLGWTMECGPRLSFRGGTWESPKSSGNHGCTGLWRAIRIRWDCSRDFFLEISPEMVWGDMHSPGGQTSELTAHPLPTLEGCTSLTYDWSVRVCKREKEIDVWVCMCLNSCIFNLCLNWLAYFSRVCVYVLYIYILIVCVINS